eukprot:gene34371-20620_t
MTCPAAHGVCRDCMAGHVTLCIAEHRVSAGEMRCPCGDGGEVTPACVNAALADDPQNYDKYLTLAARKEAERWGGEAVFCPSCDWYGIVTREAEKHKVKCQKPDCPSQQGPRKGHFCGLCGEQPHIKQPGQARWARH